MTGEASFARAARSWFVRALGFRQNRVGIAGFASWEPDRRGRMGWHTDVGLLTGVAGVALALASALSDEDPAWDRVLLLSVRSPPTHPAA